MFCRWACLSNYHFHVCCDLLHTGNLAIYAQNWIQILSYANSLTFASYKVYIFTIQHITNHLLSLFFTKEKYSLSTHTFYGYFYKVKHKGQWPSKLLSSHLRNYKQTVDSCLTLVLALHSRHKMFCSVLTGYTGGTNRDSVKGQLAYQGSPEWIALKLVCYVCVWFFLFSCQLSMQIKMLLLLLLQCIKVNRGQWLHSQVRGQLLLTAQ